MPYNIIVHISNEDPILAEIDELPAANDTIVILRNPRRRDGKDIHYLQSDVTAVIWPLNQISFIEILPSEGEEKIIGFVRE
jgi:hypothetical protein